MGSTQEGLILAERQRQAQQSIRAAAARDVLQLWRSGFDLSDIERSWGRMEPAVEALVLNHRRRSSEAAADFYTAHRTVERVPGRPRRPSPAPAPDSRQLRYSLGYYGKVVPNELFRAGRLDVMQQAGTHLVGGATRHVSNGGRMTLDQAIMEDSQATGWQRVTGPNPCAFCAMLASRGPVFKTGQSALRTGRVAAPETARGTQQAGWGRMRSRSGGPGRARDQSFHDHCQCTAEPQYVNSDPWQERFPDAVEHRQMWNDAQREARDEGELRRGTSNDALNAFRRKLGAT